MAEPSSAEAYRAAGVDIDAADRVKARMKSLVEATFGPDVVGGLGGFAGCYAIGGAAEDDPVLVASADGVGTKVLVARLADRHDTVGEDLVHHCVDDLLAARARPLFFLDYIAAGSLDEAVALSLVEGFARGCRVNGIALLGGETAEMPDVYPPDGYDLAGFVVGVAPRARLELPASVREGDVVLGLPSNGLHTNGYTLARKLVFETARHAPDETVPWGGETWADALLAVHRSYRDAVVPLFDDAGFHAAAHVTGGGFAGNLPRALPPGLGVTLDRDGWNVPPIFVWLAEAGELDLEEMARVFNLGVGFVLLVDRDEAGRIAEGCAERGFDAFPIGRVEPGEGVRWA